MSRAETMLKQLEQRRTQLTFGEKKLVAIEARLVDIKQVADGLDKSIQAIASREQLVSAVKAEVQTVHEISARTKADLAHVTEHRSEIAAPQGPRRRAAVPNRRDRGADRRHRLPAEAGRRGPHRRRRRSCICSTT